MTSAEDRAMGESPDEIWNFVFDLETMGHIAGSAITEIAAVAFKGNVFNEHDHLYFRVAIDLESCAHFGLGITPSTVKWWLTQSREAQTLYKEKGVIITKALLDLNAWIASVLGSDEDEGRTKYQVWSHATFDPPMLEAAYSKCWLTLRWKYWTFRDVRTIQALAFDREEPNIPFVGTKHKALNDAVHEAKIVSAGLIRLQGK